MANDQMPFGEALANIRAGRRVRRQIWSDHSSVQLIKIAGMPYAPLAMVNGTTVNMNWLPQYHDLFDDDWVLVDD